MQLSRLLFKKKKRVKICHDEAESQIKPEVTVTLGGLLRARGLSLHMGRCIAMGEAPSAIVVPLKAPRIGTRMYVYIRISGRLLAGEKSPPPPGAPHSLQVPRPGGWSERARRRGAATCPCQKTQRRTPRTRAKGNESGAASHSSVSWKHSGEKKQFAQGAVEYSQCSTTRGDAGPLPWRGFWPSWAPSRGRG